MKRKIFITFWASKSLFQIFDLPLHFVSFLFFLSSWNPRALLASIKLLSRNQTIHENTHVPVSDCTSISRSQQLNSPNFWLQRRHLIKGRRNSPETWEKVSQRDWYPKMPKATGYLETPRPWNLCDRLITFAEISYQIAQKTVISLPLHWCAHFSPFWKKSGIF